MLVESLFCPPSVPVASRLIAVRPSRLTTVSLKEVLDLLQSGNDRRRQTLQDQIHRLSQASVSSAPAPLWAPPDFHIPIPLSCINTLSSPHLELDIERVLKPLGCEPTPTTPMTFLVEFFSLLLKQIY